MRLSFVLLHTTRFRTLTSSVCELGAASGLPTIISAYHYAKSIVSTDYPLQSLLDVLKDNIEKNAPEDVPISIVGHEWGKDVKPVLEYDYVPTITASLTNPVPMTVISLIFSSFLISSIAMSSIFRCWSHALRFAPFVLYILIRASTLTLQLVKPKDGVVLVCFGVHGPYVNPFDFFEQAKKFGFESTKLFEEDVANTNGGDANEPQILYVYTMKLN